MIAETISLGILSLPSVLARIGLVPGLILIVGLGIIATYTGWVWLILILCSSCNRLTQESTGYWTIPDEVPLGKQQQ
jgi:amino acid permease